MLRPHWTIWLVSQVYLHASTLLTPAIPNRALGIANLQLCVPRKARAAPIPDFFLDAPGQRIHNLYRFSCRQGGRGSISTEPEVSRAMLRARKLLQLPCRGCHPLGTAILSTRLSRLPAGPIDADARPGCSDAPSSHSMPVDGPICRSRADNTLPVYNGQS